MDTDEQTLNRDNADGHSQTGLIEKKNRQVEFERQAEEQKQRQDFVYTPLRIKHLFTQASFYFGF